MTTTCKQCAKDCSGQITLAVHLCSLRVNQLATPWSFCSEDCRLAWFDTDTNEDLFAVAAIPADQQIEDWPLDLHDQDGETVLTVICHDASTARFGVSIPGTQQDTVISGTPMAQYRFQEPGDINTWWRGEQAVVPIDLLAEKAGS